MPTYDPEAQRRVDAEDHANCDAHEPNYHNWRDDRLVEVEVPFGRMQAAKSISQVISIRERRKKLGLGQAPSLEEANAKIEADLAAWREANGAQDTIYQEYVREYARRHGQG